MNITLFQDYRSTQCVLSTLDEVVQMIRSDQNLKDITMSYRLTPVKEIKQRSPLFAVPCIFEGGRCNRNITSLTGLSLVDIDHAESEEHLRRLKEMAIADEHTLLCYYTISGRGLRIIFRYEWDDTFSLDERKLFYAKAFNSGNDYYSRLLSIETDRQCKNVSRLSGLAYDPEVCYRPDAVPFSAGMIGEESDRRLKKERERRKHAREVGRIQACYDNLLRNEVENSGAVYAPHSHNDYVMRVGYKLNQFGFGKSAALEWAKTAFPDYEGTDDVISSCYERTEEHGIRSMKPDNESGRRSKAFASVDTIRKFLDKNIQVRHNLLTNRIETCTLSDNSQWTPITDRALNSLWSLMSMETLVKANDMLRVLESDYAKDFHPLHDYLGKLPQWNGKTDENHIRQLAQTVCIKAADSIEREAKQELFYQYLEKWLVAMVATWMNETVVNNVILVLIGHQGAYKTTWFNNLLPPELRQYFYTKTNSSRMNRDDLISLTQYALVCCEELDTMKSSELSQLKAVVTTSHIDERAAYAHFHEHRKHIASFCATGNNVQFLSDHTGNRRWLPFEVESILSPREHPFNHTGIYAQAYAMYKEGFRYWFSQKEINDLEFHNKDFETPRMEKELAYIYFRTPQPDELGEFISVARAMQIIGSGITQKLSTVLLGRAMSELGFKTRKYHNIRGYIVKLRSTTEIEALQKRMASGNP